MALPEYEKIANSVRNVGPEVTPNLALIEESTAIGEVAVLYDHFRTHFGRPDVPGILKCFANILDGAHWFSPAHNYRALAATFGVASVRRCVTFITASPRVGWQSL